MKRIAPYVFHAALGVFALVTLMLILWPQPVETPAATPQHQRYVGVDFDIRPATRLQSFVLSLSAPSAATEPAPAAEPLPSLVGLAGRSSYLRSTTTGETKRISVGQEVDGWRLVAVGSRAVTLRGPAGDRTLEIFAVPLPTAPAAGAADPASPQPSGP